ncbi:TraR/DksA C4-type zinc finger protein [Streptosporangium sp. NBC_01755]|uniref:TraR/DksA family transcriptional regulator n=1 Tax=unclassified Streptosporangium TaxID=2632669 RepID=UPI002DDB37EC|nr:MULTISPECIES: TraR/DksA C4-type zinc finger protein [unclassified Streptosporangium]WSA26439.1 TraR/DksA C4-type zinc finger protein [Streptosporangium sp. NBC_01810]WSD02131.1 TraR/DksA C4-type zinc finger protein [Streptosporangium sp. NBC_01755]
MSVSSEGTRLSSVQVRIIREELDEQLLWRTTRLNELEASVEDEEVSSRQDVLVAIAVAGRDLAETRRALESLAADTYGRCVGCDADIPFERLKIRPLARYCIACQRRHEAR